MGNVCAHSQGGWVTPAYPDVYGMKAVNASYVATLCWPREPWSACEQPAMTWLAGVALNACSNLLITAAGVVGLLASDFSDEVGDLANAAVAINGIGGCLGHATELRLFEEFGYTFKGDTPAHRRYKLSRQKPKLDDGSAQQERDKADIGAQGSGGVAAFSPARRQWAGRRWRRRPGRRRWPGRGLQRKRASRAA